jgi:DNA-binding transcriptional ArsR family regulator
LGSNEAAKLAKALAHPLKIEMLTVLRNESPVSAVEFANYLGEYPPNCSYHLRSLRALGILEIASKTRRGGAVELAYAPVEGSAWRTVTRLLDAFAAS